MGWNSWLQHPIRNSRSASGGSKIFLSRIVRLFGCIRNSRSDGLQPGHGPWLPGVKLSVLISAVADGPKRVMITSERTHEMKTLRIGPWIKDRILLFDQGFYKYLAFTRITEYGGFFITRVKANADPVIVQVYSTCRGRAMDLVGKPVSEILPKVKRQIVDVEVEVSFRRRTYNGKRKGDTSRFHWSWCTTKRLKNITSISPTSPQISSVLRRLQRYMEHGGMWS
jgi:hypothetical protein